MAGFRVVRSRAFRAAGRLALVAAVAALGACSTLEELDPRGGLIPHTDQPVPGTDQPYPNLASVPNGPPPTTPKATRVELQQKLAADTQATTYRPDTAASPPVPAPPAPLPQGFITAEQPVQLPAMVPSAPAAAEVGAAEARQPAAAPAFGTLGTAQRLAIVLFREGSSAIDPAQMAKLKPVVQLLDERGGTLQIVGYASRQAAAGDAAEDKIANFNLSLDRANAVASALMRLGAEPSDLIVSAEGDNAPVAAVAGLSRASANQRADIYIAQ